MSDLPMSPDPPTVLATMPDLDYAALGARLAAAREAAGLVQDDAAAIAGVHKQTWSKWERGVQQPDCASLFRICKAMRVSADHLLGLGKAKPRR